MERGGYRGRGAPGGGAYRGGRTGRGRGRNQHQPDQWRRVRGSQNPPTGIFTSPSQTVASSSSPPPDVIHIVSGVTEMDGEVARGLVERVGFDGGREEADGEALVGELSMGLTQWIGAGIGDGCLEEEEREEEEACFDHCCCSRFVFFRFLGEEEDGEGI